jgi:hypothetical protein
VAATFNARLVKSLQLRECRAQRFSPLRLERDQYGIVFAEFDLRFKYSDAANLYGADITRRAAVLGFDFSELRLGYGMSVSWP